ncbi:MULTISPECIES: PLP-dependent cysteine synthase family protein [Virgibacillus]|uniref:O-acetylserine dependent cystathionine beta-synthase n=2 Tax=Virgibacillus TaxID=84406 RepID=A0A024QFK6_9BACI|nr:MULTISPECIES: cysteine synthase family protein [Virgibacillus]EQB34889.1 cysteine synthase [Virgibacillus sp. CM-4]MYL42856.1 pyridoxal-phosphate dependent enzyme [Virgibacillus massiliensis]GGJ70018.1 cysteine synthase [Virgibacillus kapii]CDQ40751.1 O-acetylserine dependent cystathionine beta-synthase [Virgibacillus massiliensis]
MTVYKSIQHIIGDTPLLELTNFSLPKDVHLYAKLEFLNPGGSIKDRLGVALIQDALTKERIHPGGTIIEPTAGNTGIGLAIAAISHNLSVILCVPEHFSTEKQTLMRALGATIVSTPRELGMKGAIQKAEQLLGEIPNSYSPQQFTNEANPTTYYQTMAPEIWSDLEGKVDIFVAGAGSAGTFMGTTRYMKERNKQLKAVIVEPEGSIIGGGESGSHRTEGIGMEFFPEYMDHSLIDLVYTVPDDNAFDLVKTLAEKEGLLVGSSSGSAMYAALKEAELASPGTTIVTVFPDGSDRYLSKDIYPR